MVFSSENHWGPYGWKFLHYITFQFPEHPSLKEQESAELFFIHLKDLLPCEKCRKHYSREIITHPPNTRSRNALSTWLVDVHNRINKRLKKPMYSYEQAEKDFSSQCSSSCNSSNEENKSNVLSKEIIEKKEQIFSKKTLLVTFFLCACLGIFIFTNKIKIIKLWNEYFPSVQK